jgi:ketosteroid isomerase-like protein
LIDPRYGDGECRANIEKVDKECRSTTTFLGQTRQVTSLEIYGDVAIETGTLSQTMQEKGKPAIKSELRYTLVWKNVDGRWLVHRDVGTPMPPKR